MPGSHSYQINQIINLITLIDPKSILDIGVGFGKYGFLSREYLDTKEEQGYKNFQLTVDGIEVFDNYLTPVHSFIYDNIFIGNALDVVPTLEKKYDLVLLIDVLEHFNYDDGILLLNKLLKCSNNILISIPVKIGDQGAAYDNIHEVHEFQWLNKHFKNFKNTLFLYNQKSYLTLICESSDLKKYIKRKWLSRTVKSGYDYLRRPFKNALINIRDMFS